MSDDRTLGWEEPREGEDGSPAPTPGPGAPTRPDVTRDVPSDARPTSLEAGDVQARVAAQVAAVSLPGTADPVADPMIGRLIHGRFLIESRIGAGGMGIVYRARQTGIDRPVAVKMLLRELAGDEKVIKRFQIEALAVSRLNHPNTIRIYDFGQIEDGTLYFAMEFLEGRNLEQTLRREGALSVRRSLHVMRQIAASLTEAHEKGIVHRDLKPDNVFLVRVGEDPDFVKVLDFGVAKLREADQRQGTVTQAGTIFGTPRYMAPEQCRSMAVDHRADLYAIGVIGYELMTGRPPFDAENPLAILIQHVQDPPPAMAEARPDLEVPEEVEGLVMRCLRKDPGERFQSAADLVAEIRRCEAVLAGRFQDVVRVEGRRPPPRKTDLRDVETVMGPVEASTRTPRKRGWVRGAIALAVLAAAGSIAYGLFAPGAPKEDVPVPTEAPAAPPSAPAATPPAEPPVPAVVRLRVTSSPEGAEVVLGDRVLGQTPGEVEVPFGREAVSLTFRKTGFQDAQVTTIPDRDGAVSANLAPRSAARSAPGPAVRGRDSQGEAPKPPAVDRTQPPGATPPARTGTEPGRVKDLKTF